MGAARKLQSEIDRCLKKVQEGIDEFDQIWQKVHDTENANQKEKFEADLKKEIKKLQRLRDQIKSWISGADIKDKSALLEARKSIEREMERFKTCEKEAKMKQFSKAALGQADKLDPKEQAKMESREWINDMVDRLNVRIEQFEYEMEELQAGLKKKAKPPPKLVQLEEVVAVHKKHTSALEKALRCLDNDAITSEEIDPLKDDLDYYIGMDLEEHYDNTDDMYCDIADRLEAVEAAAPAASLTSSIGGHLGVKGKDGKAKGSGGGAKDDDEREKEKERERERAAAAAVKAQLIAQGNSNVKPLEEDERPKSGPHGVPRPPALSSVGSAPMPPPSPLGAPQPPIQPPGGAAAAGGGAAVVPPSPRTQLTPRSSGEIPPSPAQQVRGGPGSAAAAAAGSPADQGPAAAAATQNGPAAASAAAAAPPPPPPAAAGPAATPPAAAAAAAAGGRPADVTLAALVGAGVREQQQKLEQQQQLAAQQAQQQQAAQQQQQQQQEALPAQQAQQQQAQQQQQQAQQQQAQAQGATSPAAAGAPSPGAPSGGRLGAWMTGLPESAKAAAAAGAPAAAGPAGAPQQQQQQQGAAPTAAAVLAKGLPAAADAKGPGAPAAAAAGDKQPPAAAAAAALDAAAAAAANGPLQQAAGDATAAAAAAGGPALLEGAAGSVVLEGWSRLAAQELGLGGAMHSQVPRSVTALPVLEACMRSALPQPSDSDWNRPKPRHPIVGPASYPKSQPDVISAPGLFRKMDPEALFFAFYYQPDTYQQYLAAQELKRQSWRYHKHHNAWFQRYAEPSVTSEEYEQGTYVYFDYHVMHDDLQSGWCYRRKENFTFRYDALEDELPVQSV